ncbi:ELL-associated factor 1-like [Dreissena polymorpha]|uniref:Transcription elongation factor Eaf N-terminal domain-containing protein n=1 Tax=Dreissena polymorpha TaxID=45954 RepID=A0A9D4K902_DREPO|nr:ELL-associated factor 1-like [Dreissena polymorpha]KAH3835357.1 hypothetical protein DPMN_108706 [Dreissena polymorpha]
MAERNLAFDDQPHELKFGSSFDPKSKLAYHSIRYDFKPASVDTSREATLEIGEGHHVTLTVPSVEGSGIVYKGNKRPVQKECVLIIDHDTGTFTLERLNNNINVKKTRSENSSKSQVTSRPITPVETRLKSSPGKVRTSQSPSAPVKQQPSPPSNAQSSPQGHKFEKGLSVIGDISSDSSSDYLSSDSDSYSDNDTAPPPVPMSVTIQSQPSQTTISKPNVLSIAADLQLSDTSDDDSD